jgi:PPP family 3-phenylpropionic acid transporter
MSMKDNAGNIYLVPVYITMFFVYGVIAPYLPVLIRGLGYRAAVVGILLAIVEGAGVLGPFLLGRFSDKHGKYKGVIMLSYFLVMAAVLPLAISTQPLISAVLVAVLAIGYRSAMPLTEALATINLGESGNYGRFRVTGSLAFVFFVLLLQWIPVLPPDAPKNIAFWTIATSMLAIAVIFLAPSKYTTRKPSPEKSPSDIAAGEDVKKPTIWTPFFIAGLISISLNRLAMTPVNSFLSLFLIEYVQWDAVGLMWALASAAEIPFMFFSWRLIRRFGTMPILAFTGVMLALRLGIYAIFPFRAGIITAQLLHSFCYGLFHPAAVAFISGCVPPEQRSFGMTLYMSLGSGVPTLIGNFIGGFIIDYAGYRQLFGFFTIFAVLGAVICIVYHFIHGKSGARSNGYAC